MRLNYPGNARAAYFDRNPVYVVRTYDAGTVAPHGATERWSYTVPAGRKVQVTSHCLIAMRDTTTATPLRAGAYFQPGLTPTLYVVYFCGTLGNNQQVSLGVSGTFFSGAVLRGLSFDLSTAGSNYFANVMTAIEFDE